MSSDSLSDPLVSAGLLLGLAGLILVLGLALQGWANRGRSRRPSVSQEPAATAWNRGDEGLEAAQAPVTNKAPQAPVTNNQLQQDRRWMQEVDSRFDELEEELNTRIDTWIERSQARVAPPAEPVTNDRPPEGQGRMEELADANGSDSGWTRIETPPEVASENGLQDKDRRWIEELIARAKAAEESCGRADEASARVRRLIVPPRESAD